MIEKFRIQPFKTIPLIDHEHQRPDRDEYITVHEDVVSDLYSPEWIQWFKAYPGSQFFTYFHSHCHEV